MSEATVAITNLGCKANQYDGTYLAALLKLRNFRLVDFKDKADIYVINTCTVTDKADLDSRNLIRRAHRRNPDAVKVVTGCYAQIRPQEVAAIEGVGLVLGNNQKANFLENLELARRERDKVHIQVDDIFAQQKLETFGMSAHTQNTRAYVKIQDGCNQFCTFCIIPYTRGRNRSIPMDQVLAELRDLKAQGFHEAILTGIHLGTYGADLEVPTRLEDLLAAIEQERPIHRVRVSSIDPEEVSAEMIDIFANAQVLCPHFHIPLQSGDDETLKMMRRRYRAKDFSRLCHQIKAQMPQACIGTDVIVGFPYEDKAKFQESYQLLENTPIHYLHVVPFSPKQGTPAAKMLGQVAPELKKERASRLRQLSREKSHNFRQRFLGDTLEVILEQPGKEPETWTGFSPNYLPVLAKAPGGIQGKLMNCRITHENKGRLIGEAH